MQLLTTLSQYDRSERRKRSFQRQSERFIAADTSIVQELFRPDPETGPGTPFRFHIVSVPADWQAPSSYSAPERTTPTRTATAASLMAAKRNWRLMEESAEVTRWNIRIPKGHAFGVLSIDLKRPWIPTSPWQAPPPDFRIDRPLGTVRRKLDGINATLIERGQWAVLSLALRPDFPIMEGGVR